VLSGTFTVVDSVNGSAGTDTLRLTIDGGGATYTTGAIAAASVSNVEVLEVRTVQAQAADIVTLDASTIAGLTGIYSDRSTSVFTVTNVADGATVGVKGNGTVVNGAFNFGYKTDNTAIKLAIADGVTAGAITGNSTTGTDAATAATITSTGAANTVGTVDLLTGASTLTSLTINATTNLKGQIAAQTEGDFAASSTLTVTGGATTVELTGALANAIKTVDASGMAVGGLKATVGTGTEDIKGGAGVDTITLNTGVKTATFGAGNDVVTTAAVNTTTAGTISGGDGTDTLVVAATAHVDTAAERAVYTSFETLQNNTTAAIAASGFTGVTSLVSNGAGGGFTGMDATQAAAVTNQVDQTAITYALTTATGTSDALSVTLKNATATASADLAGATVTGFETLTVTSSSGATDAGTVAAATAAANIVSFAAAANLATINIAGAYGVNLNLDSTAKAVTVTSSQTGTADMRVEGEVVKGSSITTTANADAIETALAAVAGVQGDYVTYNAGAGNDAISTNLTALNNTNNAQASLKIDGGEGTDTLTFAAADATFADARFQYVTNIENVTLTNTTALSFTSGGFFDSNFKAAGVTLTTGTLADAATATIDLSSFTGAAKVVATSNGLGNAAAEDLVINTGSGADDVTLTASSWVGAAGPSSSITIGTGAGDDKISLTIGDLLATTSGNITINGGTGADTITVSHTNDTTATALISFKIVDGDSTAAARDKITGFLKADGTDRSDVLDFDTANVAANTAGTNGTDSGTIKSHAITNGVITFDDVDTFAAAVTVNEANLTDVLTYLASNISTAGDTVAFAYDSNSDGTADATMVFNQGASDSVVELVGVTGVTAVGASAFTANLLAIG